MKTRFYFPMIISLLVISVSLLTACGDSDNPLSDTTKPVIDLKSPAFGRRFKINHRFCSITKRIVTVSASSK